MVQQYNQSPQTSYGGQGSQNTPMTVGQYILMFIVLAIPLVNIIMLFVWAFGSNVNLNRKNYCRAALIMALIGIVLGIFLSIAMGSVLAGIFSGLGSGY